jgi:monoamine oxidase
MTSLTRRSFLRRSFAASAAAVASPAIGAPAPHSEIDVVIVGAGAAGIAAARRIAAAGRRFVLVEATDHVGGRCVTDTRAFGVPFDRGARTIYGPDSNPIIRLAPRGAVEIYPAPSGQ